MKLNIIIPVYNVEKFISDTIESVLIQSYTEFTLILVDDGSTDRSGEVCVGYTKNDSRVKYIYQENGGVSSARNKGLRNLDADCEYIGFIDGDDTISECMYEKLIASLLETNSDISCCEFAKVEDNDEKQFIDTGEKVLQMFLSGCRYNGSACNKLFRKKLIEGAFFPEGYTNWEDVFFVYEAFKRAKSVCYTTQGYYKVRERLDSATRSELKASLFGSFDLLNRMEEEILINRPELKPDMDFFSTNACIGLMRKVAENKSNLNKYSNNIDVIRKKLKETRKNAWNCLSLGRKIEAVLIGFNKYIYYVFARVCFKK